MSAPRMKWFVRPASCAAALVFLCACQDKAASPPLPSGPPAETAAAPGEAASGEAARQAPAGAAKPIEPAAAKPIEPAAPKPAAPATPPEKTPMKEGKPVAQGLETITLGGGCFWCVEAVVERLEGVVEAVSGYMGGHVENPTYEQVCTKTTGHAEVIRVSFDPAKITLEEILDVFWQAHDPTTLNRQGADVGPQYRSVVFYHAPEQRNIATQSKAKLDASGKYASPAVTEIAEASKFWEAEDYHQNYYDLNKDRNPYCRVVISPKLKKLGME